MGKVEKFLEQAQRCGWKILKKITFSDPQYYNYILVPTNGGDGYIAMWCEGKSYEAQYNEERFYEL